MESVAAAALRASTQRQQTRKIAGWAVLLSCALHAGAGALWWRDRAAPAARPAPSPGLVVALLPAKAAVPVPDPAAESDARSVAKPVAEPALEPVLEPAPARDAAPAFDAAPVPPLPPAPASARPAARLALPPARAPAAAGGGQGLSEPAAPRDFHWRGADADAAGMPRARGEPVLRLAPKPREEPSVLAQGMAKSARPSCKDAHAGGGLLALPMLLADTLTDRGCKW